MRPPFSAWRRWALLVAMAAGAGHAQAVEKAGAGFEIVTGDESVVTHRIVTDLYARLAPVFGAARESLLPTRKQVLLAIGPVALREAAARKCDCVVIAAYTSSQVWRSVMAGLPAARRPPRTVIYAEPAPSDQLRLISLLFARPVRIAAIVGDDTASALTGDVKDSAQIARFGDGEDINQALTRIAQAEVLLAMPDRTVYNTENIRNILLSTYRHNQAVIGFSADMVKAGALASTYSDIEDINAQVAETAAFFVATGVLRQPEFPRYFSTIVNDGVARSLNVAVSASVRNFRRRPERRL